MVFDRQSAVAYDHEKELVELYWNALKLPGAGGRQPAAALRAAYHPEFDHDEKWIY